jgi:hypothetical protein
MHTDSAHPRDDRVIKRLFLLVRPRTGRALALLAISGMLGLSAVIAGAAGPAAASTWEVNLSASPTTLPVGQATTLTAVANMNASAPLSIQIWDTTTNIRVADCSDSPCKAPPVSESTATTQAYVAYVAEIGVGANDVYPPPDIQAASGTSLVTWTNSGDQISLSGPGILFGAGTVTVTATTNVAMGSGNYIEIIDETTGDPLATCFTGTSCPANFTLNTNGDYLVAFIFSAQGPPLASSNVLFLINYLTVG